MDDKKKSFFLHTTQQVNKASMAAGLGFLLYIAAMALEQPAAAGIISILFGVESIWTFFSAVDLREKDKEAVSYNLLWGTGALMLMLVACAVLNVKMWLGS